MNFLDFLLFPVYVLIFYFIFSARRKNYTDPILKHYHKQGFWIKIVAVMAFTFFNTMISVGDSFLLFFTEGTNICHMILKDSSQIKWLYLPSIDFDQTLLKNPANMGYLKGENNYMIVRITAILSFLSFQKYLILNLFFSMLSFSGVWRLYRFFYEQYPHLHKQLAIAILYLPTFVFWSSGILKDPICTGALGWITYALYETFYKKKDLIKNVIIIFISGYLLYVIKVYILISYVPFFFLFLVLKNVNLIKSRVMRIGFVVGLIVAAITMFTTVMAQLAGTLGAYGGEDVTKNISIYQKAYAEQEDVGSSFSLGVEYDGSVQSLLKIAPAAIVATLFRPFLWESKKISTLFSSIESMFILFFTLSVFYKAGPVNFVRSIAKDPAVLYCLLFSLLFALFVGATTANFGTLVRYKIPCMPFYVAAMFIIQDRINKIKKSPVISGTGV
jgi:hypothetical protein